MCAAAERSWGLAEEARSTEPTERLNRLAQLVEQFPSHNSFDSHHLWGVAAGCPIRALQAPTAQTSSRRAAHTGL